MLSCIQQRPQLPATAAILPYCRPQHMLLTKECYNGSFLYIVVCVHVCQRAAHETKGSTTCSDGCSFLIS